MLDTMPVPVFSETQLEWIKGRPPHIQKVIHEKPALWCYRHKDQPSGHYCIYSYDEDDQNNVTLKIDHLNDSFMPGIRVFGVNPDDLIYCGCMKVFD